MTDHSPSPQNRPTPRGDADCPCEDLSAATVADLYRLLCSLVDERLPESRCAELRARLRENAELYRQLCCEEQIRELLNRACCEPAPVTLRQRITMSIRISRG